ncbi:MAG: DNA adenine methylase [Planctomycetes bacterium]|nr:DNA adenine methylase [Planctomycetota bacterium]
MPKDYSRPRKGRLPKGGEPAKAAFAYYGAKQRLARQIASMLPRHNAWVEGFCGSAALTLAKPAAPIEVINDLDGEIVNVFRQLRDHSDALCRLVALTPYSSEEFECCRKADPSAPPLERARRFLVRTMMIVNGSVDGTKNGFSYSQSYARQHREARVNRWYNLPDRLKAVVERLRGVRIECRDARELMEAFVDRPATLVYLDPPYFTKRRHGYVIDAKDEDFHRALLQVCLDSRCMILLSGYDNKLYRSLLTKKAGWSAHKIETHTRDTTGKDYARTEVLWTNVVYTRALESGRVPIRLSKKERADGKINPQRAR